MSRLRMTEIDENLVPVPPTGKATIYLDLATGVFKAKFDDGSTANLVVTDEYIQDISASLLTNGVHTGISVVYDDANDRINLTNEDGGIIAVSNHVAEVDPHTQYLFKDGTKELEGNMSLGNNRLTNAANPVDAKDVANLESVIVNSIIFG